MSAITPRENLLRLLKGEPPEWVPFVPEMITWFQFHKNGGTLPKEITHCVTIQEVFATLEWDSFIKQAGTFPEIDRDGNILNGPVTGHGGSHFLRIEYTGDLEVECTDLSQHELQVCMSTIRSGNEVKIRTPHGELDFSYEWKEESATTFERGWLWQDFDTQYQTVKYFCENEHFHFDAEAFAKAEAQVGDSGIPMTLITQTPLKLMHLLAGPENGFMFILDHEPEILEIMELHTEKTLVWLKEGLDAGALVFNSMDNLNTQFFPPDFMDKYCVEHFQRCADLIHDKGGYLWCHACGHISEIVDQLKASRLDGLEGVAHPPLGDTTLPEALGAFDDGFTIAGGMTCYEEEVKKNPGEFIDAYVKKTFDSLRERQFRGFIFGSACCVMPVTPWDNIRYFFDACRKYGRA
jgi:uroporphyrinogen-III decarboxylase